MTMNMDILTGWLTLLTTCLPKTTNNKQVQSIIQYTLYCIIQREMTANNFGVTYCLNCPNLPNCFCLVL